MKTRRCTRLTTALADAASKSELRDIIEEEEVVTKQPLVAATVDEAESLLNVLLVKKPKPSKEVITLASCLDPGPRPESYFCCGGEEMAAQLMAPRNRGREGKSVGVVGWSKGGSVCEDIMKKSVLTPDFEQKQRAPPIHRSKYALKKQLSRARGAGKEWFNMAAPTITPQLKDDLKLLKMRNSLDPSRHYKNIDMGKGFPRYFQEGRVVVGHADFYASRIPRKAQKQTLVDELLSDQKLCSYQLKKFRELQSKFSRGKYRHRHNNFHKKFKKKDSMGH